MGICSSGFGKDLPDSWLELFYVLTFSTGNIRRLCDIFHKLEADESGSVHIVKLLKVLNVESNCFTEQVFTMFDSDGSGKSDFREFVLNLWDFCTISPASLDSFTFNLYDRSQMGYLTCGEISQMLKDIHGKNHVKDGRVKLIDAELCAMDPTTTFDLQHFLKFAKTHQALLFPAFNLQDRLRKGVLGESFWKRASSHRTVLSKGKYVSLANFLQLYLEKGLYERAVRASNFLRMSSNARSLIPPSGDVNHAGQIKPISSSSHASISSGSLNHGDSMENPAHPAVHSAVPGISFSGELFHTFASFTSGSGNSSSTAATGASSGQHHVHHTHGSSNHPPSSKKAVAAAPDHHKSRHGAVLSSTAAALDGDMHFNTSLKGKPVHATGHHMTDVIGAKRKSVAPAL